MCLAHVSSSFLHTIHFDGIDDHDLLSGIPATCGLVLVMVMDYCFRLAHASFVLPVRH